MPAMLSIADTAKGWLVTVLTQTGTEERRRVRKRTTFVNPTPEVRDLACSFGDRRGFTLRSLSALCSSSSLYSLFVYPLSALHSLSPLSLSGHCSLSLSLSFFLSFFLSFLLCETDSSVHIMFLQTGLCGVL